MNFNYGKICSSLLKDLPERQKQVILRRFGLERGDKETLESIGKDFGITRERVRQVENDGLSRLKPKLKFFQEIFHYFRDYLKDSGGLKKEEFLLSQLGRENYQPQVFFLLTLGDLFERFSETEDFYPFWTLNQDSFALAEKAIDSFCNKLTESKRPLSLSSHKFPFNVSAPALESFLEISKIIQRNDEGLFGLRNWPEINPRGVKDKAYLVFKNEKKPLHFREVSKLIRPGALPQTTHNELIKDPRFILVGRGIYALKEWGYEPGDVKDVISKILKETDKPLSKKEVLEQVLKQRLVKENTVLLNLNNKKYFVKTREGKYITRK